MKYDILDTMKTELPFIILAYNCEAYLEEGLNSVPDQMPQEYEPIVVDDRAGEKRIRSI